MNGPQKGFHRPHVGRLMAAVATAGLVAALGLESGQAQVTTDTAALNALGTPASAKPDAHTNEGDHKRSPTRARSGTAPVSQTDRHATASEKPAASTATSTPAATKPAAASSSSPPPPPTIPAAPPPLPVLTPPPIPVEVHPFPMPADPPAVKDAVGEVRPIVGGLRITFAADSAQLNPETKNAVLAFGKMLLEHPDIRGLVDVTASGVPNDPSRPRRMSLSRGLAVRAVLMNAGVPSTRIYVRVIGLPDKTGIETPADRADMRRSDEVPPP
ncbi:OmpA family protein [Acetobacter conturbans]|uniref:OmpA family protein n=1 Tax=Acetobacter conturbans TaxID=1737472 RepID=A0ABX0K235_9PROT|nr:hypothetical protein [Acetobacter conturbans]NHN89729.1 OmpA family protein [Acetobacter conturbans]